MPVSCNIRSLNENYSIKDNVTSMLVLKKFDKNLMISVLIFMKYDGNLMIIMLIFKKYIKKFNKYINI